MFALANKTALVTGAARGLGVGIARGLAQAGARVIVTDIEVEGVQRVAASLRTEGHAVSAMKLDVRSEVDFQRVFDSVIAEAGGVDILVNNAAITPHRSVWDIGVEEWDEVMAVNVRGVFFGCRVAAKHMRERRRGRIVNLSSLAAQQPSPVTGAHYAAAKAGVFALTRTFAQELAPHGVTVNTVSPAVIRGASLEELDEAAQKRLLATLPVGRYGEETEVAAAVVYLASDAAGFTTGTTLDLNGGRLMR